MKTKIGIIGFGNMGSAIFERIKSGYRLFVFDKEREKTRNVRNLEIVDNITDLIDKVDVVVLAVKPQDFDEVIKELKNHIKDKLIISIAAGIATGYIEKCLGNVRVIRVMPNMPARIGKGMSCLCKGQFAAKEDLNFSKELFDNLGETLVLNEDMMDAATAISGSGPGFFYDLIEGKDGSSAKEYLINIFIPSLRAAAEAVGFTIQEAEELAQVTGAGSMSMLKELRLSPAELKKQVVSRGGTTEAGLEVSHSGGTLTEAVKAAIKRAKELSRARLRDVP